MVDEVVEEQVEAAKEERVVTEEVEATTGSKERWIDMVEEEAGPWMPTFRWMGHRYSEFVFV